MTQLNWGELVSQAKDTVSSYEPLPDGEYELKIIEATAATTSNGKPMFKITTEVQSGPFARRRVWGNLIVSRENDTALGIFFSQMAALGLPKEYFANNAPTNDQITQALLGRGFRGTLGRREYGGKISNEIKRYAPLTQAGTPAGIPQGAPMAQAPAPTPAPAPAPAVAPPPPAYSAPPMTESTPPAPPF